MIVKRNYSLKHSHYKQLDFFDRLSSVTVIIFAVMSFCSSRILIRSFIPSKFADCIWALIATIICLTVILLLGKKHPISVKHGLFIFIFGVLSLIRSMAAGVKLTLIAQAFLMWVSVLIFSMFMNDKVFLRLLLKGFVIAMFLHLIACLSPSGFIIYSQTSNFGTIGNYGIYEGIFSGRNFGLTEAPGFLALLSGIGIATAIILFMSERKMIWVLLFIESFLCGIMTLNRSFVLAFIVVLIIIPFFLNRIGFRTSLFKYILMLFLIFVPLSLYVVYQTNYGVILLQRFEKKTFEDDIYQRTQGESGVFGSFSIALKHPFIGSILTDDEGCPIGSGSESKFNRPHNGFGNIFAGRGFIFGIIFLYWTIKAFRNFWKVTKIEKTPENRIYENLMFIWLIIGNTVALGESFLETFPVLIPLVYGLSIRRNESNVRAMNTNGSF